MAEQLNRTVVSNVVPDGLLDAAYANHTIGITVEAGQGELERGTVLAINEAGKAVILGTEAAEGEAAPEARYILNKAVDATEADAVALAYDEGRFIRQNLIVKEGYEMTAADVDALRVHNICIADEL